MLKMRGRVEQKLLPLRPRCIECGLGRLRGRIVNPKLTDSVSEELADTETYNTKGGRCLINQD